MRASSGIDSTLKHLTPARRAWVISFADLPTPEKTQSWGLPPAAMTRSNSPPLTKSKPAPSLAKRFKIARLLFAFIAKCTRALLEPSALKQADSYCLKASVRATRL